MLKTYFSIPNCNFLSLDKNFSLQVFEFAMSMHEKKTGSKEFFYINNDLVDHSENNDKEDSNLEDDDFEMSEYLFFKNNNDGTISAKKSDEGKNQSSCCCSSKQKKDKYDWQYKDTLALIRSYGYHLEEKNNPVQKSLFWENMVNDLISQKFNVNKNQCQTKWNSLYQSYKSCKDKTGRAPDPFKFYDEIDEFLGHKPTNSSPYSLGSLPKKNKEENKMNTENTGKKNGNKKGSEKKTRSEDYEERRFLLKKAKLELAKEKLQVEKEKCEIMRKYIQLKEKTK